VAAVAPTTRHVDHPIGAPVAAGALLAGGCVALAAVDPSGGPILCPLRAVTGLYCPLCGGTRALHQLFTGHMSAAFGYNALVILALPVLAWIVFASLTATLDGPRWPTVQLSPRATQALLVALIVFGVLRNLPAFGVLAPGP
jgi:hypothetical protein